MNGAPAPGLRLVAPAADPPAALGERDDDALMLLAAADHRAAFEALAARHLPRLTNFCSKYVGGRRFGEELAQETLLEVWARRSSYRPSGRFEVYLFVLARNRCRNHKRGESRRGAWQAEAAGGERLEGLPALDPNQLDQLLEQERCRRAWALLQSLSPKLREAVLLRFDQGLEYAQIARIVGRSEETVRSRVFLALKKLREEATGGET